MDQGPLVTGEIDAGAELVRQFDNYKPVKAAFWLKESDDEHRFLYLASERIDANNIDVAYGEVLRLTALIKSSFLDPFRVKLINAGDPLAMAAVEINRRFPSRLATRLRVKTFGGVSVDDVYVYPAPLPAVVL